MLLSRNLIGIPFLDFRIVEKSAQMRTKNVESMKEEVKSGCEFCGTGPFVLEICIEIHRACMANVEVSHGCSNCTGKRAEKMRRRSAE